MEMDHIIDGVWGLTEALNFGGVAVAVVGVGIFGWTFVKLNALAARGESSSIPSASWRGRPSLVAATVLACGVGMQVLGYVIAVWLPFRT